MPKSNPPTSATVATWILRGGEGYAEMLRMQAEEGLPMSEGQLEQLLSLSQNIMAQAKKLVIANDVNAMNEFLRRFREMLLS